MVKVGTTKEVITAETPDMAMDTKAMEIVS